MRENCGGVAPGFAGRGQKGLRGRDPVVGLFDREACPGLPTGVFLLEMAVKWARADWAVSTRSDDFFFDFLHLK